MSKGPVRYKCSIEIFFKFIFKQNLRCELFRLIDGFLMNYFDVMSQVMQ